MYLVDPSGTIDLLPSLRKVAQKSFDYLKLSVTALPESLKFEAALRTDGGLSHWFFSSTNFFVVLRERQNLVKLKYLCKQTCEH